MYLHELQQEKSEENYQTIYRKWTSVDKEKIEGNVFFFQKKIGNI